MPIDVVTDLAMSYHKKPKIPYEIKNAREWDPNHNLQDYSSSEDSDDGDSEDYMRYQTGAPDANRVVPAAIAQLSIEGDGNDEGLQEVQHRRRFTKPSLENQTTSAQRGNAQAKPAHNSKTITSQPWKLTVNQNAEVPASSAPNNSLLSTQNGKNLSVQDEVKGHMVPTLRGEIQTPDKRPRYRPIFNFKRDNDAVKRYRERKPPSEVFKLHKTVIEIEGNPGHLQELLFEIGKRCGSFVRLPETPRDRELLIWGNKSQVFKTVAELRHWILQSEGLAAQKTTSKEKFGHEVSIANPKFKQMQKEMERAAAIRRFQQAPDPDQHFEFKGAYLWPVGDVKPQEIFGPSLEAFDEIRFALKCHITFDDKYEMFRISTDKLGAVGKALRRIQGALKDFQAQSARSGRTWQVNLVEPPERRVNGKGVRLQGQTSAGSHSVNRYIPVLTDGRLDPKARMEWEMESKEMAHGNAMKIQQAMEDMLPRLSYYRAHIRVRMHFGTFALTKFKWPVEKSDSILFEEFMDNLAQSGTKGAIIRDLQMKREASEILGNIYSLNDILMADHRPSLDQAKLTYGARFEINRFEKPAVQLEVEMVSSGAEIDLFEKMHSRWTRLDRKDDITALSIFMIRLGGTASWKLQVSTETLLEGSRVDSKMVDFANSIKLTGKPKQGAEIDGRRLFDWETTLPGCLKPSVFEQKIALRYRLRHSQAWSFEIARYDSYDLSTGSTTPISTEWGATLWNGDWDLILADNADLGIGECAKWNPILETFFPKTAADKGRERQEMDTGLRFWLQNVQMISECLDMVNEMAPHLRA